MIQIMKEEKFTQENWDDVFHMICATTKWLAENVKSDKQLILEGKTPPSHFESSHAKKKQQKD